MSKLESGVSILIFACVIVVFPAIFANTIINYSIAKPPTQSCQLIAISESAGGLGHDDLTTYTCSNGLVWTWQEYDSTTYKLGCSYSWWYDSHDAVLLQTQQVGCP